MDTIVIRDLVISAKHGVHPHEKRTAQRFRVAVELMVDIAKAAASDSLEETLDYEVIRDKVIMVVTNNSFNLIERLAQVIAESLLEDQRIIKVTVSVDKLDAFPSGVPGVRLELTRS